MSRAFWNVLTIAFVCTALDALAASWTNKNVGMLQAAFSGSDCFYFQLNGVTEADPVVPGSPWFAIARSQNGSKDAYAALLAAKFSGAPVQVHTNGTISCGYATASEVFLL